MIIIKIRIELIYKRRTIIGSCFWTFSILILNSFTMWNPRKCLIMRMNIFQYMWPCILWFHDHDFMLFQSWESLLNPWNCIYGLIIRSTCQTKIRGFEFGFRNKKWKKFFNGFETPVCIRIIKGPKNFIRVKGWCFLGGNGIGSLSSLNFEGFSEGGGEFSWESVLKILLLW